ncbi:DUF7010 family protein [Shewanella cyperi]|uniref:DUF7010 family protein n=1 Tax=Shewanella cyperi TaxID=2814292 RepID=UPI001A94623F|nr:hypothetical protein [Shewanella cyperi]QSX39467.1 hypothetical protein JYB84_10440 [Shewanella cyperi]
MQLKQAQSDMRYAYYGGAPGVFISSLVWGLAAVCSIWLPPMQVILVFFVGGMFIYPVAVLLTKLIGRSGSVSADNPLRLLAFENTALLIFGFPLVYAAALVHLEWFFPAMMLLIGGRYMTFGTMYGSQLYRLLGCVLALSAYAMYQFAAGFTLGAIVGAAIEVAFAILLTFITAKEPPMEVSPAMPSDA